MVFDSGAAHVETVLVEEEEEELVVGELTGGARYAMTVEDGVVLFPWNFLDFNSLVYQYIRTIKSTISIRLTETNKNIFIFFYIIF